MDEKKIEMIKLEHQIEVENKENIWETSCMRVDKRCVIFANQCFFGFAVLVFCMIQLTKEMSTEDKMVYITMLSSTVAIFLPSPSLK
jgi:hypothetical protein